MSSATCVVEVEPDIVVFKPLEPLYHADVHTAEFGLPLICGSIAGTTRHSAVIEMASNGIPIEKVSQYLGHRNVAIIFSTYARFAPSRLQGAAAILDLNRPMLEHLGFTKPEGTSPNEKSLRKS